MNFYFQFLFSIFIFYFFFIVYLALGACVGKLLQDQLDDGKQLKLSRKQMRKALTALGAQLSDSIEGLIFEALGKLCGIKIKNNRNLWT